MAVVWVIIIFLVLLFRLAPISGLVAGFLDSTGVAQAAEARAEAEATDKSASWRLLLLSAAPQCARPAFFRLSAFESPGRKRELGSAGAVLCSCSGTRYQC